MTALIYIFSSEEHDNVSPDPKNIVTDKRTTKPKKFKTSPVHAQVKKTDSGDGFNIVSKHSNTSYNKFDFTFLWLAVTLLGSL